MEHPVLFLSDPSVDETVTSDNGASVVTATEDCICFWVLSYVDGNARITVSGDDGPAEWTRRFSGSLATPSKIVALSNGARFTLLQVPVKEARTSVEIWAPEDRNPEWVWVKLDEIDTF